MANLVYEIHDVKLSDGTEIQVCPLRIKYLKKFTVAISALENSDNMSEDKAMEIFIQAGMVCMEQFYPELSTDKEKFEEVIEVPTLMRILEIAGGLKLSDPNLAATGLVGQN